MNVIKHANDAIKKSVNCQFKAKLLFSDLINGRQEKVEPYLSERESSQSLKIILNFPFFLCYGSQSTIVTSEEIIDRLAIEKYFEIQSIEVTEQQVLEISCKEGTILAFPGIGYGWEYL